MLTDAVCLDVQIELHDTVFTPDGRPFFQDDPGLAIAEAMFPPLPSQFFACIRSVIASAIGLVSPTRVRWDPAAPVHLPELAGLSVGNILGNGWKDTGCLQLLRIGVLSRYGQRLLPAPLTLMKPAGDSQRYSPINIARFPGSDDRTTTQDFTSDIALSPPSIEDDLGSDALHDSLIDEATYAGLVASTATYIPSEYVADISEIFAREAYVGLALHPSKTNIPGHLYAVSHLRAKEGVRAEASKFLLTIALRIGDQQGSALANALMAKRWAGLLGGRGRSVTLGFSEHDGTDRLPAVSSVALGDPAPGSMSTVDVCIYAIGPLLIGSDGLYSKGDGNRFLGCDDVKVLSATHGRVRRVSWWDSTTASRSSWSWMIPAGAVFHCRAETQEALTDLKARIATGGLNMIDEDRAIHARNMGFGDAVIGAFHA